MKEEFDDILKRKWAEQHFPVDEGHRKEMMALLDRKNRRKAIPFWWFGGLGMAAIFAGYVLLSSADESGSNTRTPFATEQEAGVRSGTIHSVNNTGLQDESSISSSKEIDKTPPQATQVNPSTKSWSHHPDDVKPVATEKNVITTAKPNQRSRETSTRQTIPIASEQQPSALEPIGVGKTQGGTFQVDEEDTKSYQIVSKTASVTIEPATRYDIDIADILLPDFTGIEYSRDDLPAEITPHTAYDKSFYVFGETGMGMIFASRPDFSSGWKFRAGAGVGYKISPRVQLSLSLGYLLQSGGFDFQRSSTVQQAGFGTRSSFNTLTPDKLHYVYSRIGAQYRIKRHLLGLHGGFQYLYGAQGELVTQVHDQFVNGVAETSTYTWLVTDGLRKINWTADVSYGYQLTPRLFASAGADFYFAPITINDQVLSDAGYYWSGAYAPVHPFITLNYLIYAGR